MGLTDKIRNAKHAPSMFDEIPADRMFALKTQARIALAIITARKNLGMNQSEFADYCHVSQPMISKWESGEYNFTVSAWAELSHRLSLPFDPFVSVNHGEGYRGSNAVSTGYQSLIVSIPSLGHGYYGMVVPAAERV